MFFGKQKFDVKLLKMTKFTFNVKQLKMNKFIFDARQLKMNKFMKSIPQFIIRTSNATLEVTSLHYIPAVFYKKFNFSVTVFQISTKMLKKA